MKTITHRYGIVRDRSDETKPRKVYVSLGLQDERVTVLLSEYVLTSKACDGWTPVKTFKGKTLYHDTIHIGYQLALFIFKETIDPKEVAMFHSMAEKYEQNRNK